ncbi:LAMI_0D12794g1_1 [Lachancea mirantina]|uniref:LAMI_0D12794g1_1 n=1 Tax=Lachancea mirantina TaxID=1230905 RepID=A0A1G4JFZ3_9SACH|nr:LAMI_0D12794g1_1 [Lachancea mirantina]
MGNVPGKLDEENAIRSGRSYSTSDTTRRNSASVVTGRAQRASSLVGTILNGRTRSDSLMHGHSSNPYKRKSTKEKERLKEKHAKELVVKFDECVDGGFLAPFGCFGLDKLDYDARVVKGLIVDRKLAPFYLPLDDFDPEWTRKEVVKVVDALPLHAPFEEDTDEYDGVATGSLADDDFDSLIDKTLSRREQRKHRLKIFNARLYKKRIAWQEKENERYLDKKLETRSGGSRAAGLLMSDDLKVALYTHGTECPICFLYFPEPMNKSRCCLQPICSQCFVQIKRAPPHFPHDEEDTDVQDEEKDPNLLVSEPASCPYCATPDFGVTYDAPEERRVGVLAPLPGTFVLSVPSRSELFKDTNSIGRRGSVPADDPTVVKSDTIRPDWQIELNKERMRLARRSANATAIHVSNQLVDPSHQNVSTHTSTSVPRSEFTPTSLSPRDLEQQMIDHAIRLSLAEQKDSKRSRNSNHR